MWRFGEKIENLSSGSHVTLGLGLLVSQYFAVNEITQTAKFPVSYMFNIEYYDCEILFSL